MKVPMCPICETTHWGLGACPSFAKAPKAERAKKAAVTIKTSEAVTEIKPVTKSKRGGKRPGAGRKPIGERAIPVRQRVAMYRANKRAEKL
jgi:hypothetical protein